MKTFGNIVWLILGGQHFKMSINSILDTRL